MDKGENMIMVDLPGTGWEAPDKWYSTKFPLVLAWLAKPSDDGKGTRLVISLKKNAKISYSDFPPGDGYPLHRIILDIQGL